MRTRAHSRASTFTSRDVSTATPDERLMNRSQGESLTFGSDRRAQPSTFTLSRQPVVCTQSAIFAHVVTNKREGSGCLTVYGGSVTKNPRWFLGSGSPERGGSTNTKGPLCLSTECTWHSFCSMQTFTLNTEFSSQTWTPPIVQMSRNKTAVAVKTP